MSIDWEAEGRQFTETRKRLEADERHCAERDLYAAECNLRRFAEPAPEPEPTPPAPDAKDLVIEQLQSALSTMAAAPVNVQVDVAQHPGAKVVFKRDRSGAIVGAESMPTTEG